MGAHVDRHRLIGNEQLFRDHKAYGMAIGTRFSFLPSKRI
jgi:hypothetical protein